MEFILLAAAHFLALLSPGPDFFLILETSLRLPKKFGFALCMGIAAANGVYIILALAGHESLGSHFAINNFLQYAGGLFLVYVGISILRAGERELENRSVPVSRQGVGKKFCLGFCSAIANPKNGIFYLSLFTVMVSASTPLSWRILYGLWMCLVVLVWDMAIVCLLRVARLRSFLGGSIMIIDKISGTMLVLFGVLLTLC